MTEIVPGLVSIIIPVFNRPQMLREAVASALAQTHRPIEIIIVDDGSTDDTPRVSEDLVSQNPGEIVFVRKPNTGPGPTREAGRLVARGEYIQYLDSDDLLRPRKLEIQIGALQQHPECGAAYGWICIHPVDRAPLLQPYKESGIAREYLFPRLLADRWWDTNSPLLRRTVCDAVGPWTDIRWSQDWEYDGRIGALGTKLVYCPDWVCDERHHRSVRQTSNANWAEPTRLRERMRFLQAMFGHAVRAGVTDDQPERVHFTRWVFTTARICASAGLISEAKSCLELAEQAAGSNRQSRKGIGLFRGISTTIGWRAAGQTAVLCQALKRPSGMTLRESSVESRRK